MNHSAKHIEYLWNQYLTGQASQDELEEWALLHNNDNVPEEYKAIVEKAVSAFPEYREMPAGKQEALLQKILRHTEGRMITMQAPQRSLRRLFWAAAVILLLVTGGILLWTARSHKPATSGLSASHKIDIPAGKTGAILTLSDGSQIVLDSMGNGIIADQQSTRITLESGRLLYDAAGNNSTVAVYNTMSTPKGRQFHLLLPDGTQVWLNSESAIRYPTAFNGKERAVSVAGEAYFQVAQNASLPFKVSVNGSGAIEVLGTEFNVNAYNNEESIRTTLINGSVRVKSIAAAQSAVVLTAGQQARFIADTSRRQAIKVINDVDLAKVTAWKNGGFDFENVTLSEAMRQLERWYDIKVILEPGVPRDAPFYGQVSREISLQNLLKLFEKSKLKFRLEENRTLFIYK